MKERYNVAPWNDGKDAVCKAEDGKYILYTDHLAEIREIVDTYDLLIDRCDKKNSELEDERERLKAERDEARELLKKALPRMAHRFECVRVLPSEMWHQNGSVSLDSCKCEIGEIKQSIEGVRKWQDSP
jgi:DNA repair exonuclease SbcCD ATPase subunit